MECRECSKLRKKVGQKKNYNLQCLQCKEDYKKHANSLVKERRVTLIK